MAQIWVTLFLMEKLFFVVQHSFLCQWRTAGQWAQAQLPDECEKRTVFPKSVSVGWVWFQDCSAEATGTRVERKER